MTIIDDSQKMLNQFGWVLKVIHSCTNEFHLQCARTIIDLFQNHYNDDTLYQELLVAYDYKKTGIILLS